MRIVTASSKSQADQVSDKSVTLTLRGKDYVFAQTTIVSSVTCEPESHLILPQTAKYINANGDGWTNDALRANYKSFIGAWNFVNHVQDPEKGVGFIADAVLRRIMLEREANLFIYYTDILVATHREAHPELVKKILSNRIEYLSMGCESFTSTCSACGQVAADEEEFCDHLLQQKGKFFIDKHGKKRITAELLGDANPGSVEFYEASWLTEPPAFGGAVKRNLLPIGPDQSVEVSMPVANASKPAVQKFVGDLK